jgi:hypothetical protein
MDKLEFMKQMLPLVMSQDIRLQVHTLNEVEGKDGIIFAHTKDCARCAGLNLLGYVEEYEYYIPPKLSTVITK